MFALLITSFVTKAQVSYSISGEIKDNNGRFVPYVTITLRSQNDMIIAATNTDQKGLYKLKFPDSLHQKLYVQATSIGFKKKKFEITSNKWVYDFVLEADLIQLGEVEINNRPAINRNGDTLSYNVKSFSRIEDRSIGDVIKHLPGVTVEDDGRILFNGQAISNLYTGGDDLMGGKYSLATKSISKGMIKSVEILKNHQPIKVLKGKVLTDDVAMNLVLEDENSFKFAGEGMLGGGPPHQFDGVFNLILLNKKLKMLNSLKANNSGVDYRGDFNLLGNNPFGNDDLLNTPYLVNNGTISNPDLPRTNYYINKSASINLNNLINKNGLQFRFNLQGFVDKNDLSHNSLVMNYLADDTLVFNERQNVNQKSSLINTGFTINKNNSNIYYSNSTNVKIGRNIFFSPLNFNGLDFNQALTNYEYVFANNFSYIPRLKNNTVLSFKWNVSYFSNPQELYIDEGLNADILNNGLKYNSLIQNINTPSFFSDVSASYLIPTTVIKQNYQFGFISEFKKLNSHIIIKDLSGSNSNYNGDAGNSLKWLNQKIYFNPNYSLKTDAWQVLLNSPIQLQYVNYRQAAYQSDKVFRQITINPSLNATLKTGDENNITAKLSYKNNIGDISNVYKGNILSNYRTFRSNDADLQVKRNFTVDLKYHLEKSIDLFFANLGVNYSKMTAPTIAFTTLTESVQQTVLVPLKNSTNRLSFNVDLSKYLFFLKAKVQASASLSKLNTSLYLNSHLLPYSNHNLNLSFGYDSKLFNSVSIQYNGNYSYNKGGQKNGGTQEFDFTTQRYDNFLTANYQVNSRFFIDVNAQFILNKQENQAMATFFLINSSLKYKFLKPSIEVSGDVSNILNVRDYTLSTITTNSLIESVYNIRSRMGILRISYIF